MKFSAWQKGLWTSIAGKTAKNICGTFVLEGNTYLHAANDTHLCVAGRLYLETMSVYQLV